MPADPATLTATPGSGKVTLSWATVAGATGYKVYRKPDGYPSASYGIIADTTDASLVDWVPNYDLSDLTAGPALTAYDYKVTAYDGNGESSGIEATATMADISPTNMTNGSIKFPPYDDGTSKTASYTISNPDSETAVVNDASKSIFENRLRALNIY